MNKDTLKSKQTKNFLNYVSRRLSSRIDCKQVEFIVDIGVSKHQSIMMTPEIHVYKDLHHRSDTDYHLIVDHVLYKYFSDYILNRDEFGDLIIDISKFSTGVYKYELSRSNKKRRWIRI